MILTLSLIYIVVPLLIIIGTERYPLLNRVGAVIIAYILGLILGHIGLIPHPGDYLSGMLQSNGGISNETLSRWMNEGLISGNDIKAYKIYKLQELFTNITIPLAIPLLLFTLKIKIWLRMSVKTLASMLSAIFAVVLFIVAGYFLFRDKIEIPNKIAGMLVGLYTGGTPNLASLKQSLNVDAETYIVTHTYDTVVGVFYLLFLITFGKNIIRRILRPYPKLNDPDLFSEFNFSENSYAGFLRKPVLMKLGIALLTTAIIVGVSVGVAEFVQQESYMLVVILMITTLGVIASLLPVINKIEKTFELGMYFIVVFSFVVASMADVSKLLNISVSLLAYISLVYFGALLLHALLCKLFDVDADTLMVTSAALLCSPPFVPMVAGALKNREVIVSGLTVGIIGYAVGNYLGIILAGIL